MAAYIFHEIRNDQNAVCGAFEMFGEDTELHSAMHASAPDILSALLDASMNASHASQVITNMLEFTKFRAGATTDNLLLITCYVPLATCYLLLITYYSLLATPNVLPLY